MLPPKLDIVFRRKFKLSKKIYVGNLPFQATEEDVRQLFEEYGEIESVAMITDRDTGRFRGFCFVEMADGAADAAMAALDGQDFNGRDLRVNEARPREERGGGGYRGGRGGNRGGNRGHGGYNSRKSRFPDSGGGNW